MSGKASSKKAHCRRLSKLDERTLKKFERNFRSNNSFSDISKNMPYTSLLDRMCNIDYTKLTIHTYSRIIFR